MEDGAPENKPDPVPAPLFLQENSTSQEPDGGYPEASQSETEPPRVEEDAHGTDPSPDEVRGAENGTEASATAAPTFRAMPFTYETVKPTEEGDACVEEEEARFAPPFPFTEEEKGMKMPRSLKEHLVIEKTVEFVRREGDRLEFQLKLSTELSNLFPFIQLEHPLHDYYQSLKRNGHSLLKLAPELLPPQLLEREKAAKKAKAKSKAKPKKGNREARVKAASTAGAVKLMGASLLKLVGGDQSDGSDKETEGRKAGGAPSGKKEDEAAAKNVAGEEKEGKTVKGGLGRLMASYGDDDSDSETNAAKREKEALTAVQEERSRKAKAFLQYVSLTQNVGLPQAPLPPPPTPAPSRLWTTDTSPPSASRPPSAAPSEASTTKKSKRRSESPRRHSDSHERTSSRRPTSKRRRSRSVSPKEHKRSHRHRSSHRSSERSRHRSRHSSDSEGSRDRGACGRKSSSHRDRKDGSRRGKSDTDRDREKSTSRRKEKKDRESSSAKKREKKRSSDSGKRSRRHDDRRNHSPSESTEDASPRSAGSNQESSRKDKKRPSSRQGRDAIPIKLLGEESRSALRPTKTAAANDHQVVEDGEVPEPAATTEQNAQEKGPTEVVVIEGSPPAAEAKDNDDIFCLSD